MEGKDGVEEVEEGVEGEEEVEEMEEEEEDGLRAVLTLGESDDFFYNFNQSSFT